MGKKESHNGGLGYLFGAERKRDKKGKSLEASPLFFNFFWMVYFGDRCKILFVISIVDAIYKRVAINHD
jgi:hypothetical protein